MANVIVSLKIMPDSPDEDLKVIEKEVRKEVTSLGCEVGKVEIEPLAFGLNVLRVFVIMDENKGGTDPLEAKIKEIKGVTNVEVTDVRRAIG